MKVLGLGGTSSDLHLMQGSLAMNGNELTEASMKGCLKGAEGASRKGDFETNCSCVSRRMGMKGESKIFT